MKKCVILLRKCLLISNRQKQKSQHEQNEYRNKWIGCELERLDELGLFNFASKAITNEHCSGAANNVFKHIFKHKLIKIGNQMQTKYPVTIENDTVLISDLRLAANTLRHFGGLISRLSFEFEYLSKPCTEDEEAQNRKLLTYVNKYTHASLDGFVIHFSGCDVDIFGEIIDKFTNVSRVSIHISQVTTNTDNIRLDALFPDVQHLDLTFHQITDPNFIDCEFKKLEHLHIDASQFDGVIETTFTSFMEKNPNITHMSIVSPTKRLLQIASKHLNRLKDLRILQSIEEDSSCTKVYFPRVRTVVVRLSPGNCYPPRRITFGSLLDEIALICSARDIGDDFFNFLFKYPNITKVSAGIALTNSNLQKINAKIPNLSEAFFSFNKDVTAENIKQFFDRSRTMNVLRFYHSSIENVAEFHQRLNKTLGADFVMKFENHTESTHFFVNRINTASTLFSHKLIVAFLIIFIGHTIFV